VQLAQDLTIGRNHAKCLDADPEMFFCEADDVPGTKAAIRICLVVLCAVFV
jgi:hypothetical protein